MSPLLAHSDDAARRPPGAEAVQLVVFTLDGLRCALHLAVVARVVHMVEITPLPKAPAMVHGIIDFHGEVIPVLDVRRRFHLPAREGGIHDRLVIARTATRLVALAVDTVAEAVALPAGAPIEPGTILPGMEYVSGVVRLQGDLIFIQDLDAFLSLEEEQTLEVALHTAAEQQYAQTS